MKKILLSAIVSLLVFSGCGTTDDSQNSEFVSNLVSGTLHFYDLNGNVLNVPENTYIRLVPDSLEKQNIYSGINCKVESNGSFGKECKVDADYLTDIKDALDSNQTFQFVVYAENGVDLWNWNADEYQYYYDDNMTSEKWENVILHIKREYVGYVFNLSWLKTLERYAGDHRYDGSVVTVQNGKINLYTTKVEGNETRASAFADLNSTANEIYTEFILNDGGKYRKYKNIAITDKNLSYNGSSVSFYAGLNVNSDYIGFWGGLYDGSNIVKEYTAGGCNLSNSVVGKTLKTYITGSNNVINYRVTDSEGNVLCQKDYNTSDLNISGEIKFEYTKVGVQIDDDNAAENNETAGNEVNATVLDFQTN